MIAPRPTKSSLVTTCLARLGAAIGGDAAWTVQQHTDNTNAHQIVSAVLLAGGAKRHQLPDAPKPIPDPTPDQITACTDPDTLRAWWAHSSPATRELINARGAALKDAEPTPA